MIDFLKKHLNLYAILSGVLFLLSLYIFDTNREINLKLYTNNIFIFFIFISTFFLSKKAISETKTNIKYPLVFSILFSIGIGAGYSIFKNDTIFCLSFLGIFTLFPFVYNLVLFLFDNVENIEKNIDKIKLPNKIKRLFFERTKKSFFACFLLILLCYMPIFIIYFSGVFIGYDTVPQLSFFMQHWYTELHPLLHSIMIYLTYLLSLQTSSEFAISIYTLLQMSTLALIFSYCIHIMAKYKFPDFLKSAALIYFVIHPIVSIIFIIATKDVYFSAFVTLFTLMYFDLLMDFKNKKHDYPFIALFILVIVLMLSFRHNAIWAYILAIPFIFKNKTIDLKKKLVIFIIPIVIIVYFAIFKALIGIKTPGISPMLSVPLQQISRVFIKRNNAINSYQKEIYKDLVSEENQFAYNKFNADMVKFIDNNQYEDYLQNYAENNFEDVRNLYFNWMISYPIDYTDAFLIMTSPYWYLNIDYEKANEEAYLDYVMLENIEQVYEMILENPNKKYKIKKYFESMYQRSRFDKYPILSSLFSMAVVNWLILLCAFILCHKKQKTLLLPFSLLFFVFLTVLFGPFASPRYIFQNYTILPFMFSLAFNKNSYIKSKEN